MKFLIAAIAVITLTSCNWREPSIEVFGSGPNGPTYKCSELRPIFFFNPVRKVCDTKEECNTYCEELRKEYSK